MMSQYPHIFEPFHCKSLDLKNRIVMMPMGTNYGEQTGEMSFLHIHYYEMRAKGGTGLIIMENVCVDHPSGSNGTTQLRIDQDNFIPRLFYFCETIHKHGAKVAVQINHAGASAMKNRTGLQPVSASNIPSKAGGEIPRPLTADELTEIARKYGEAARRAQIAGFDAVEIHCGHSYLISQFLSPLTNNRTDEFGGSPANRARFPKMVLEAVRQAVGPGFPIIVRVSADELIPGGNTLDDSIELMRHFCEEADLFNVSCGLNASIQYQIDSCFRPDGWRSFMARRVKEAFGKPVIAMGNMRDPKVVEDVLAKGDADMIGMGRGLIAEPEWVNKVQWGQEDMLRKCISCNVGCAGNRIGFNRPIRCTVNPNINQGEDYAKRKIKRPCNVVVIGGGTAGLEAACTAAEVGCSVFLFEKEKQLGGLARYISQIPDKRRMMDFVTYLQNRASRLKNLYLFSGQEADMDQINRLHPDIIVNATGSHPLLPPIKGLKESLSDPDGRVGSIRDMIDGVVSGRFERETKGILNGKRIAVIGGGAVGIDVVEYFAPRGAACSIVEMMPEIGRDLDPVSKSATKQLFADYHVAQYTGTRLTEVRPDSFLVERNGKQETIKFDYGFVCLGMRANAPLMNALTETFSPEQTEIYNIGDSVRARRIIDGVREGHDILRILEKRDFFD
ncbi:MAG: NAD(P)/FAD-dependent oxidoreductase [Clostridiales bacterium]|nr:NAD(P)/FAD-dependent oxidoreductase [Clostridiales bacterium]